MATQRSLLNANVLLFCAFALVFGVGFSRVHMRVQTTLIGYELGRLKASEAELLAKRAQLQMLHAKITTKKHLFLMANTTDSRNPIDSLAANP